MSEWDKSDIASELAESDNQTPKEEMQQIVQETYLNVLEDYELDTWIPYNYKWKGILNSYTRKYPAHHVIKAIHTAEYYLQESEYHDNKETIKNFTKKIGGILHNRSLGK